MRPSCAVIAALAIGAALCGGRTRAGDDIPQGRTEKVRLMTALVRPWRGSDGKREVLVYTPAGYGDPANARRRYPVVYLLHGSPGNPFNFIKFGSFPEKMEDAIRSRGMQAAILILPDGNYVGQKQGDSEWADSADRRDRFESWIVKEVVPWADAHYRTRTESSARVLAGVSEGGFGAVNLALRNPRVFGAAVGLSGYYDMRGFGWGHIIMNDSDAAMSFNSPLYYIPDKVAAGRVPPEWKTQTYFVGAGIEEKPYAQETRQIADRLRDAGVKNVTAKISEGKHDWNLWSGLFFEAMRTILPPDAH